MMPEFLRNRKTYMLTAIIVTILGVLGLSFAFFRAQTTNQPTNSTVMVETVDIAGSIQRFTVYYDNNDGFFETGLLNISSTYTDIMKFRVISECSLGSQNISINWKSVKSGLTKENTSYDLYSCTEANYGSATLANINSLCTKISLTSGNYLPATDEKTRLTSASDITLGASATNYYIATISIPVSETGKSFDGAISVKHNVDHTLTLNLNGGTLGSTTSMTLGTGDTVSLPGPIKTGFMVTNWITSCTECEVNSMEFTMGTSDATITAEWVVDTYNYEYNGTTGADGSYQLFIAPQTGTYNVQAWGAAGGNGYNYDSGGVIQYGGHGAYTKGEIFLLQGEKLYVYVGNHPGNTATAGYNGGGSGRSASHRSGGGGGATDIRYFSVAPTDDDLIFNSEVGLNSRIMVAAGGGGGRSGLNGSAAGGLEYNTSLQTTGYSFGIGTSSSSEWIGTGGGGYYGGFNSMGGSSYISGHIGSNSIESINSKIHTGNAIHYSNKYFINTKMIDGFGYNWTNVKGSSESMPNPSGGNYASGGNIGNGYVKVSFSNYTKKSIDILKLEKQIINEEYNYSYTNIYQKFTVPRTGTYQVESWGARGGNGYNYDSGGVIQYGGHGAYTKGKIYLTKDEILYLYVGNHPGNSATAGFNGGGSGKVVSHRSGGGGGATDIRYFIDTPTNEELEWNSESGLNSRIMVAAGGAGGRSGANGSIGGGLYTTSTLQGYGNDFGVGANSTSEWVSPGGGGYYGGTNAVGGNSYISGHNGCNSVESINSRVHTGSALHFSNKYFLNTKMIDGAGYSWSNIRGAIETMPNPTGGMYASGGNIVNGYAKISFLNDEVKTTSQINQEIAILKENYNFEYSGNYQVFTVPQSGTYKIEAWGAQGGTGYNYDGGTTYVGGKGAYTKGEIYLLKDQNLFIYVGFSPGSLPAATFNGGGYGQNTSSHKSGAGGGATDIRYFINTPTQDDLVWNSALGLNARIMVAGAGGGSRSGGYGSVGGGLQSSAATQYSGYNIGIGANGGTAWIGGGGGGYYGGTTNSGGSSFISGHAGCLAIDDLSQITSPRTILSGCTSSSDNVECSYHRALTNRVVPIDVNKYFQNTQMIDGSGYEWTTIKSNTAIQMPDPTGGAYSSGGNAWYGFVQISFK